MNSAAIALTVLLIPNISVTADDWPQWRGPERDGASRESGWSSTGAEADLWRAHVGRGYTQSIVADGRLYTVGFYGSELDDGTGEDVVVCLDTMTGSKLWSISYPSLLLDYEHEGGTLATPAIDGDELFVMNREGVLRCLDARTGDERWVTDFREEFDADYQRYGFASAPVVVGDRVFVNADRTVALDRSTGDIVWMTEPLQAFFATPCPFALRGEACLAVFGQSGLTILDQAAGSTRYHVVWRKSERNVEAATPVVVGESIFLSSAYDHGCGMYSFLEDGTVETVYRNRNMRNKMAGCILHGDHLYGFDESMLKCIDTDGNEKWRKRGFGNGSVMVADDRLIIMTSRGELIIAEAKPEGFDELSRTKVFDHGVFWSAPVLADGLIFCRSGAGELVCRDHRGTADIATASATSDVTTGAADLPDADALLANHIDRIGGLPAVRAIQSMTRSGAFEMRDVGITPTTGVIKTRIPNQWHSEWILPPALGGAPIVEVFDGEKGWKSGRMGGFESLTPERLAELQVAAVPHDVLDLAALYPERRTVGLVEFDERPCIEVLAKSSSGSTRQLYFERDSNLLAGVGGDDCSISIFRNYQAFGDVRAATVMKVFEYGTGIEMTWTFDQVEFDNVDASEFDVPRNAQSLFGEVSQTDQESPHVRRSHQ